MPSPLKARAPEQPIDLLAAAERCDYHPDWLRKLIHGAADPPPFTKQRGRWLVLPSELEAWLDRTNRRQSA